MASGILQTPDRLADHGNLRNTSSPKTMNVPTSSQHMLFVIPASSSDAYTGVYLVSCSSGGAVAVNAIKAFTTTTIAFDTATSNKLTMTSTSTTTVTIVTLTLRGDKMYL